MLQGIHMQPLTLSSAESRTFFFGETVLHGGFHRRSPRRRRKQQMGCKVLASSIDPLLVKAARGEVVERPPAWMMRQAGRYMAAYRKVQRNIHLSVRGQRQLI